MINNSGSEKGSYNNMRKYLPTLGELIDRLSIVQLKEVKIPQSQKGIRTRN